MDTRLIELLKALSESEYQASHQLAKKLSTSYKTIRKRAKELDELLPSHGASILTKPNKGYRIEVADRGKFDALIVSMDETGKENSFYQSGNRAYFLVEYLVSSDQYIKMEDFCEILFVSKNTLSIALKKAEELLVEFGLELTKRPNYGMKCSGSEWQKRLCITHCLVQGNRFSFEAPGSIEEATLRIGKSVLSTFREKNRTISELALQELVQHLYTAEHRISQEHLLQMEMLDDPVITDYPELMELASAVAGDLADTGACPHFPLQEVAGIAIMLAAISNISYYESFSENLVISQETMNLAVQMLETVYDIFKIDLRDDLELRLSLCRELIPLQIRLKYDMRLDNPMLEEIKAKYFFPFTIAAQSMISVIQVTNRNISDDEIGYFALLYALALEKGSREKPKRNVLLVCATGKSTAQLLVYKYEEEFADFIDRISVCDVSNIGKIDFSEIDYVFTTVPIKASVPVPILTVELFPEEKELMKIKQSLTLRDCQFLLDYYRKDLFFTHIQGDDKESIIHQMCVSIARQIDLPENFEQSVIKRENLASTDFGNLIAFPHPYKTITQTSFVAVCILPRPVQWVRENVQVVLLASIGAGENARIQDFYKLTTGFIRNREAIRSLITSPTFETFIGHISNRSLPTEKSIKES